MRDGEQINCEEGHNEYSCILPLAEKALHIDQNGSRKAISYYKKSLERIIDTEKKQLITNL